MKKKKSHAVLKGALIGAPVGVGSLFIPKVGTEVSRIGVGRKFSMGHYGLPMGLIKGAAVGAAIGYGVKKINERKKKRIQHVRRVGE